MGPLGSQNNTLQTIPHWNYMMLCEAYSAIFLMLFNLISAYVVNHDFKAIAYTWNHFVLSFSTDSSEQVLLNGVTENISMNMYA